MVFGKKNFLRNLGLLPADVIMVVFNFYLFGHIFYSYTVPNLDYDMC